MNQSMFLSQQTLLYVCMFVKERESEVEIIDDDDDDDEKKRKKQMVNFRFKFND